MVYQRANFCVVFIFKLILGVTDTTFINRYHLKRQAHTFKFGGSSVQICCIFFGKIKNDYIFDQIFLCAS